MSMISTGICPNKSNKGSPRGIVFERNDEWWKVQPASSQQPVDSSFRTLSLITLNTLELLDIERKLRQAYTTLKAVFDPAYEPPP